MSNFWSFIWSLPVHDSHAQWTETKKKHQHLPRMINSNISLDNICAAVRHPKNWTLPGVDDIYNYWWEALTSAHVKLSELFSSAILDRQKIPGYFTQGITHMIFGKGETIQGKKYRPIVYRQFIKY